MNQDILNLNRTTKSILKNPDTKSSLAYTNSILRKDPSKVNTEGIGLNPNLNVEDEYIENLQKQIHFMDLEIKLLKEKQAQDEALGGNYNFTKIGLKDGKPPVDHIMTATNKIKQMKLDLTKQINFLEQDLLRQQRENNIHRAKVANLQRYIEENNEKLKELYSTNMANLNDIKTKLLNEKRLREETEADLNRLKAQLNGVLEENKKLIKNIDLKNINQALAEKRFEEDEKFDKEKAETKQKLIEDLQAEKAQLFLIIEKNERLQVLRKEHEELVEKAKEAEKKLNELNYQVLEMETLQQLSIKQKDEEIETRKRLQEELEKWKDQLDETVKNNELKVQKKLREAESNEIKQLQAALLREERELNDLKQKFNAIDETEKAYIIDEQNRKRHLEALQAKNEENAKLNQELFDKIQQLEPRVIELHHSIENLKYQIEDAKNERAKKLKELRAVEEEKITLDSKYVFMNETIRLDEDMKNFNIEELRSVMSTNQIVNDTIRDFMEKWDFLKRFSKSG